MLKIQKGVEGMKDVTDECYSRCIEDDQCSGFHYRIDDRYDGRGNGNCWFFKGDTKLVYQNNPVENGGSWIEVDTGLAKLGEGCWSSDRCESERCEYCGWGCWKWVVC